MRQLLNVFRSGASLRKVVIIATVLAIAGYLAPEPAQAQARRKCPRNRSIFLIRRCGGSNFPVKDILFNVDSSVSDSSDNDLLGIFPNAIRDFNVLYCDDNPESECSALSEDDNLNNLVSRISCPVGTLIASPILPSDELDDLLESLENPSGFANGGVKYTGTFGDSPGASTECSSIELTLIFPSDNPEESPLVNSLEAFGQIPEISGKITGIPELLDDTFVSIDGFLVEAEEVPEASMTLSLLNFGTLGALNLLRRSKRSK